MSDTTTPGSPVQRTKKSVETTEFDAFARRILRAYGRRVADGDIEALRSLATFAAEIDTVTRAAVTGLRQEPYSYSWSEIASRLGVTKQAVQMRYGTKPDPVRLDQRLIDNGLNVSVALLVSVFADHHPGLPAAETCVPAAATATRNSSPTARPTRPCVRCSTGGAGRTRVP